MLAFIPPPTWTPPVLPRPALPRIPAPQIPKAASLGGAAFGGKLLWGKAGGILGGAARALSTAANALVLISVAADLAERYLAPRWFDWVYGTAEKNQEIPPGTYLITCSGSFRMKETGAWWGRYDGPERTYQIRPGSPVNVGPFAAVVFPEPVGLTGVWISGERFPLSGEREAWLSEGSNRLRFEFSDGTVTHEVLFEPRLNPGALGPFYEGRSYRSKGFQIKLRFSPNPPGQPAFETAHESAIIEKRTLKILLRTETPRGLQIPQPEPPPRFLPPRLPKPRERRRLREPVRVPSIAKRPTPVPTSFRGFLEAPSVSPELEPLKNLVLRLFEKECPPPCPPCEKEESGQGGRQEPEETFTLFWVDREGQTCQVRFGQFPGRVPQEVQQKVQRTAQDLAQLCCQPVVAGTPEDEAPWRPPLGVHLKVIWCPTDQTRGYYYFRVPHWRLGQEETLNLDWDSLRWRKGLRNQLEIKFSSGKKFSVFGDSLENLEELFSFLLQGIETGLGYEKKRIQGERATSSLVLKVRKLELWSGRAGHPDWWSWWPPL